MKQREQKDYYKHKKIHLRTPEERQSTFQYKNPQKALLEAKPRP